MQIVKTLLVFYLRRYPSQPRLSQFNFLSQYAWIRNLLEEVRPQLFPQRVVEETVEEPIELEAPSEEVIRILESEIRGRRGTYRVDRWLGARGRGYLFAGTQLGASRPVVVKEYLLNANLLNEEELLQRQEAFVNLAGVALADGRTQDLRVISPIEAIADQQSLRRCYLISEIEDAQPTLRQYLRGKDALPPETVRQVLLQVLQTLEMLHQQKFRLPSGLVQTGLVHGNLSLDSLVWVEHGDQFYIYLTDLALWEQIFDQSGSRANPPSVGQDLKAVGQIGFTLLTGLLHPEVAPDPTSEEPWIGSHPILKEVIRRLLGLLPPFERAFDARQRLLEIAQLPSPLPTLIPVTDAAAQQQRRRSRLLLMALGLGLFALVAALLWRFWPRPLSARLPGEPRLCCLDEVEAVPSGRFTYTAVPGGSWSHVLHQTNLQRQGWTLMDHLAQAHPGLDLVYDPSDSVEAAIAKVQQGEAAFAILPRLDALPIDVSYQEIAYDGLAVFVAFSYARRARGLPTALEGKLNLEQLQQLYLGQVDNWQNLGGARLPVALYAPDGPEARYVFESYVLPDLTLEDLGNTAITEDSVLEMLRAIIRDFESQLATERAGGIGFSPLSTVFGQCSVYPLAIQDGNGTAIQPLVLADGEPIQPTTDLCDRKGTYHPDVSLFQTGQYPLAYPVVVVYPQDNRLPPVGPKIASVLTTIEGQQLLMEAGLVPLMEMEPSDVAQEPQT